MLAYIYDGTFSGLLTAVFIAWNKTLEISRIAPQKAAEGCGQIDMLEETINVDTDNIKAGRVSAGIIKISQDIYNEVYTAFLTETPDCGLVILKFLHILFAMGRSAVDYESNEDVARFLKIIRHFHRETHRLYGFTRFTSISEELLYSRITPDGNQLEPLASFFLNRLPKQCWVIHDIKRNTAAICNGSTWFIQEDFMFDLDKAKLMKLNELSYETMWSEYLKALTIRERENKKQQRNMLPMKYRECMTEFN